MSKCINLDAHEAIAAAEGRLHVILRPLVWRRGYRWDEREDGRKWPLCMQWSHGDAGDPWMPCPYGSPGDVVVGREAWRVGAWRDDGRMAIDYKASPELVRTPWVWPSPKSFARLTRQSLIDCVRAYESGVGSCRARDESDYIEGFEWKHGDSPCRWRSPATMPAALARHRWTLDSVELVRVAQISKEDAIGAGATRREWPKEHPSESGYGWSMGWLRVGELSQYAGGIYARNDKRPLKERHVCLGSPRTAVGNWWNSRWGKKHPWETAWAWKLGVKP